jgi:hypothetical protein
LPPQEAVREYTAAEEGARLALRQTAFVGDASQLGSRLRSLAQELEVEEIAVITWTWDPAAQRRSYELLAREFGLGGAGA